MYDFFLKHRTKVMVIDPTKNHTQAIVGLGLVCGRVVGIDRFHSKGHAH